MIVRGRLVLLASPVRGDLRPDLWNQQSQTAPVHVGRLRIQPKNEEDFDVETDRCAIPHFCEDGAEHDVEGVQERVQARRRGDSQHSGTDEGASDARGAENNRQRADGEADSESVAATVQGGTE